VEEHVEPGPSPALPISKGIPRLVIGSVIVAVLLIFTILSLVFANSGFGHAWPSSNGTQIKL